MVSVVACLLLGLVLVAAAGLKLAGGAAARAALATYGLAGRAAYAAWAALIAAEAGLGFAVGAGLGWAARAAALLAAGGALAQIAALAAGRAGAPCGCFGARGRVGNASVGRALALAAALALVPVLPRREPSTDGWLAIGLVLALAGIVALAVVVLALAREVGMLRLAVPQAGALEVAHEGPEIGARLASVFDAPLMPGRLGLAVFTSEGCGVCRALAPAIARFGAHPSVVLRTFDEAADAAAWAAADVPGSPFAVALDADGTVLAKGTFNTGAQLESVLAAAERRRGMVRARGRGPGSPRPARLAGGPRPPITAICRRPAAGSRTPSRPARRAAASSLASAAPCSARPGRGRWRSRRRPTRTTSAATSTPPTPARTPPGCPASTREASR